MLDRFAVLNRQLDDLARLGPRIAGTLSDADEAEVLGLMRESVAVLCAGTAVPADLDALIDRWEAFSARVLERFA